MSLIFFDEIGPSAGGTSFGTRGVPKAWAQYDMTGVAGIDDGENFASITDQAAGQATLSLTNPFSTVFFSSVGASINNQPGSVISGNGSRNLSVGAASTSVLACNTTLTTTAASEDTGTNAVSANGDLA